jgi:hypothetical protein
MDSSRGIVPETDPQADSVGSGPANRQRHARTLARLTLPARGIKLVLL